MTHEIPILAVSSDIEPEVINYNPYKNLLISSFFGVTYFCFMISILLTGFYSASPSSLTKFQEIYFYLVIIFITLWTTMTTHLFYQNLQDLTS